MSELHAIHISVRSLVEFLMREGDIDSTSSLGNALNAMQEGSRLHRMIQGEQTEKNETYEAEVTLTDTFYFPEGKYDIDALRHKCPAESTSPFDFALQIEGRADGVLDTKEAVTIEEIKGMYYDVTKLEEPVPVHLAQAKSYAYLYLRKHEMSDPGQKVTVQLTYISLDTQERMYFHKQYTFAALEEWFFALLEEYRKWAVLIITHLEKRNHSLQELTFPYEYRKGQRRTAAYVYRTIEAGKKLYLQAPTGSGKTLAVIFPTLKAIGLSKADHLYYLTAKTITRKAAEDAFNILHAHGLYFSTLVLTAKSRICPLSSREDSRANHCRPDQCPYAKGHYDRINDALYEALSNYQTFDRNLVQFLAEKHQVCPFEFSLDISDFCDGVICDYNYVFDPSVHLQRFVYGEEISDTVLLIDEAHNLPDRARNMFSAVLSESAFVQAKKDLKALSSASYILKVCNALLRYLKKRKEDYLSETGGKWRKAEDLGSFCTLLKEFNGAMEEYFSDPKEKEEINENLRQLYFDIRRFLNAYERSGSHYLNYEEINDDKDYVIHIFCADPSKDLKETLKKTKASIFFSATLLPMDYYRKLLCAEEDDLTAYAQSVFDESRRQILITSDLISLYQARSEAMYQRCAAYIKEMCASHSGNYLVFFPSFLFMDQVSYYLKESENLELLKQEKGMREADKEDYLEAFAEKREEGKSLCGLAVLGSVFSEGINLEKEQLVGVMVIGTGIPQISNQSNVLQTYFDENGGMGFAYAYTYPGMAKILQAAGRLIRTEEDTGVLLLADKRLSSYRYQNMFPPEWKQRTFCSIDSVGKQIEAFWKIIEKQK